MHIVRELKTTELPLLTQLFNYKNVDEENNLIRLNPETKVSRIIPLLNHVDQVLIMSVKPGKGGQKFMEDVLYKVETLKDIREQNGYHYIISIDGGINNETAKLWKLKKASIYTYWEESHLCLHPSFF